uniref:Sorting nexin 22 n=1 Tax=Eptatretus burgeri TaxID=7764 RepID=A0A8C4NMZ3_EPTBU
MLEVAVPAFSQEGSEPDRGYTLFKVEVLANGRKHVVKKRYSEFYALNKKLKKVIQTPEFPSKHVRNWIPKVMEQRRQGLENYLQGLICQGGEVPKPLLEFLGIRHLPSMLKTESLDSLDVYPEDINRLSHQPILGFSRDPYIFGTVTGNWALRPPPPFCIENSQLYAFTHTPPWPLQSEPVTFMIAGKWNCVQGNRVNES